MNKCLVCGDLHGNWLYARQVFEKAKRNDCTRIIQVGDMGIWPGDQGEQYINQISKMAQKFNIDFIFLPGNHEDYNQLDKFEKDFEYEIGELMEIKPRLFYTGKYNKIELADKQIGFVGGAVSIDRKWRTLNKSWWNQEQLSKTQAQAAMAMGKVDYLFTHDCPQAHPFGQYFNMVVDLESSLHRQRISDVAKVLDPSVWFHGHMHHYAEYLFGQNCKVYGLDCDGELLNYSTKVFDLETGAIYEGV